MKPSPSPLINSNHANFHTQPEKSIIKKRRMKNVKPLALAIMSQRKAFQRKKMSTMQSSQQLNLSIKILNISFVKIFQFFHQTNTTITKIRSICRNFRIAINNSLKTISCFSYFLVRNHPHKKHWSCTTNNSTNQFLNMKIDKSIHTSIGTKCV